MNGTSTQRPASRRGPEVAGKGVRWLVMSALSVGLLTAFIAIQPIVAGGSTLYVGGSGPGNYTSIQLAVDAASVGDTIYVYRGTYAEQVTIGKAISLVGEDKFSTIVQGSGDGGVVNVTADSVNITGFTIRCDTWSAGCVGLMVFGVQASRISGNIFPDDYVGVRLHTSNNITLTDNVFSNNFRGVVLYSSTGTTIERMVATNGTNGVSAYLSDYTTVNNSVVADEWSNGLEFRASNHFSVTNNTFSRVGAAGGAGVYAESSSDSLIAWNHFSSENWRGIYTYQGQRNRIVHNDMELNPYDGIVVMLGREYVIGWNRITDQGQRGMDLNGVDSFVVTDNVIARAYRGIEIYWASAGLVANNTITDISTTSTGYGIEARRADNTTFLNNTIRRTPFALRLYYSNDNRIVGGNFTSNENGVYIEGSSGNKVDHNDFYYNGEQAFDNAQNVWDDGYPSGGNCWGDYPGSDLFSGPNQDVPGSDGIGDTSYPISGGTTVDRYPLYCSVGFTVSPTAPQNLRASPGDARVNLTWEPPGSDGGAPVTNYRVYMGNASHQETLLDELGTNFSYEVTNLTLGQLYFFELSALNAMGEGQRSEEVAVRAASPPSSPENLTGRGLDSSVALTWSNPYRDGGAAITGFAIYRGTFPGGETLLIEAGVDRSFTDTGVTNGITYYYQVSAKNAIGEGPRSSEQRVTPSRPVTVPSAPEGLQAVAGDTQVVLTWSAPPNDGGAPITNYRVYRGTTSGGETFLADTGDHLTYTDTGLTNGQAYYYRVAATNAIGEGSSSTEARAMPATPLIRQPLLWVFVALALASMALLSTEACRVPLTTALLGVANRGRFQEKDDSLGRGMVLGFVIGSPGANYTTIKRRLQMNNGALSWHLDKLEKDGLIRSIVQGTRRRYHPAGIELSEEDVSDLLDIERRLLEGASNGESMSVGALAGELGISRQRALYHLRNLHGKGLITLERRGLRLVAVRQPHPTA